MKQEYKISMKLFAFVMALLMLMVSLPVAAFAGAISASTDDMSTSVDAESETVKKDVIVLEEDEALRDENIKHFKLSDGTTKAVVYSQAVHYKDADGKWVDIDNALTLNGSEYSSNNKSEIKFANKSGSNGLVSIKDGDYKIDFTPLNTNKVSVVIENPQSNNSRKFEDMSVLNNLVSKAIYADIYDGIDIEYILVGNNIKENIIVKEKQDSYTFSFELKLNKLSAELKDGTIILSDYDTGDKIYEIPAPYMFDANNVHSDSVEYSLVQDSKWKYTFTVTADAEWINADDRAFPVTVDPAIGVSRNNIVCFYETEGYVTQGGMVMHAGELSKIYFKLSTLPELPNSAYITDANIKMYCNSGIDTYIGAYEILNSWSSSTIKPSTINSVGIFANSPVDYVHIEDAAEWDKQLCIWNIVDIVRKWYSNANYGVGFNTVTDTYTSATFSAMTYDTISCRPFISIEYRDMKGIESYYPLISQSMGIGGTGYINLATGNLTFEISTLTTTENIFGYTPSMIYNSSLAGKSYENANTENGYWYSFAAKGFKLNMNETLIKKNYTNGSGETAYYYVWTDSDATEHYFLQSAKENEKNIYYDEDGMQLKLVTGLTDNSDKAYCKIVDSSFNERIFYTLKGAPESEGLEVWHLTQLKDKNGNILRFYFDGAQKPNDIKLTPYGTTNTITMISPLYNSSGIITLLWCDSAKEGVLFRHSDTSQGEVSATGGSYLREMLHLSCASNISWTKVLDFIGDTDNDTEGITVNSLIRYGYTEDGLLESIENAVTGQSLKYKYRENGQVYDITEYGANNVLGQSININYHNELTLVRSSGVNEVMGDRDDLFNYYLLDNHGRVVSSYTTNFEGNKIYGATVGQYVSDNENAKNSIKTSSIIGVTSSNYLINGDFECLNDPKKYWSSTENISAITINANNDQTNTRAIQFDFSEQDYASIFQHVYLNEGKYTLSLYASTINASNVNLVMNVYNGNELIKMEKFPVFKETGSFIDYLVSFDFEISGTDYKNIKIEIYAESDDECETIFIDNVMLAKSIGVSEYNHVTHGSFENSPINTSTGGNTAVNVGDYWYYETINNANDIVKTPLSNSNTQNAYVEYYNSDFENALRINGSISEVREVKQDLFLSNDYKKENDNKALVLTVSGFGRSSGSMFGNTSEFGLKLYYEYINENEEIESDFLYFPFNSNIDFWQYTAGTITIPCNAKLTKLVVACVYSHNINEGFFDNITVTKSLTNTISEHDYYEDGKIKYQKDGLNEVFYTYENGLVKEIFTNYTRTIYTYDKKNRVIFEKFYGFFSDLSSKNYNTILNNATFSQLYTKTHYIYDNNEDNKEELFGPGLLTSIECISMKKIMGNYIESEKVVTTNDYYTGSNCKIYGTLKSSTDSLGKKSSYFVNQNNGRLIALIEPDNTGLYYTYDGAGKLVMVQPATCQNETYSAVTDSTSVIYTYNSKNQLESINTNGTVYTFNYDDFGNQKGISIGESTLVSQTKNAQNGKVTSNTYSNGVTVFYEYDELERISKITYQNENDMVEYTYEYDARGNLHKITDLSNNTVTSYKYDMASKLTGHIEYDINTGIINSTNYYNYDEDDRLKSTYHRTNYLIDSTSNNYGTVIVNYSYQYDINHNYHKMYISLSNISKTYEINYEYDIFERLTQYDIIYNDIIKNTINYSYITNGSNASALIEQYGSSLDINGDKLTENIFNYEYDDKGNIIAIRDGCTQEAPIIYSYEYDELGQLIRENNSVLNKTYTYSYDNNGNITSVKTYAYTLGYITGESISEDTYNYGNNDWKDQLTSFNGYTIVYDGMGNPTKAYTKDNELNPEYKLTWDNIRRLMTYEDYRYSISYTYNDEGIRTSKTVDGVKHEYVLEGNTILFEKYNDVIVIYFYDEAGAPIGMAYRKASEANLELDMEDQFEFYLFTKNLQGDILNIYSEAGTKVASYNYDAWGKHTVTNYTSDNIGDINPFRYRGYFYDIETGLYYLNSRYYDAQFKRLINSDDILNLVINEKVLSYNSYSYCINNPIKYISPKGTSLYYGNIEIELSRIMPLNEIIYDVPLYNQGDTSLCWAFCQVMVECYQNNEMLSQEEATERAIELAIQENGEENWNTGNWPTNLGKEIREVNNINFVRDMLIENQGPIYAYYYSQNGTHLVVVTGVNVEKNIIYTNNPWEIPGEQTFEEFKETFAGGPQQENGLIWIAYTI